MKIKEENSKTSR